MTGSMRDPWVFILFTVVIMGGAGYLAGQALAANWRPGWQVAAGACLLGLADRFLLFALFEGQLLSLDGFLLDTCLILVFAFAGYRRMTADKMVSQYPWLFERNGPFGWRRKGGE